MSWRKSSVFTPITDEIGEKLKPVTSFLDKVDPVLKATSIGLKAASVFVSEPKNKLKMLIGLIADELEALVNDVFGTGFYTITVGPFEGNGFIDTLEQKLETLMQETDSHYNELDQDYGDENLERLQEELSRRDANSKMVQTTEFKSDSIGVPMLPTYQAINIAIDSFDDVGDEFRPQFSKNAQVSAIGIMATAPSLGELLDLIRALISVIEIPSWKLTLGKATKFERKKYSSVAPDWRSIRMNSFSPIGELHNELLNMIYTFRGYQTVADTNIDDLIQVLDTKVNAIRDILDRINSILKSISHCTGIYVMDLPKGVGGNERIKQELRSALFSSVCGVHINKYTILTLFVGGGPSLEPVDKLRNLLLGK